ncbi:MAG: hypothetical protein IJ272_08180 [Clostridia bacterium]|nr:hypothetical protein [Clostridia bacterium]
MSIHGFKNNKCKEDVYTKGEVDNKLANIKQNYSTTEQVIGTWIDGKPLYRCTKVVTNIIKGSNKISWEIPNIDKIINLHHTVKTDNADNEFVSGNLSNIYMSTYVSETKTNTWLETNKVCPWCCLTIEYTKTTD